MPNFIDCKITVKGPDRQAVLDKIKGQSHEGEEVYFQVENIIPRPEGLGDKWQDWGYENWGCRNVYPDRQWYRRQDDADVIGFCTPWSPPLLALVELSRMFPENTFLLQDRSDDGMPNGTTLFRGGKSSHYYVLSNYNSNTGKTATLYEIFCAVLRRKGTLDEALSEVERVKALRLDGRTLEGRPEDISVDDENYDPALDAEVEAIITPYTYDVSMIPTDEEQIATHVAGLQEQSEPMQELDLEATYDEAEKALERMRADDNAR
jgi:hypothetical protein